jgi:lipopolysaccharide exporter
VWQAVRLGGAKVIFLARMLILARLLAPEDFGLMAIAVVGIEALLTVSEFGMIPALVQRPQADRRQFECAWTIGLLRALGVALVVFVSAPAISAVFAEPRAVPLLRVMALRPVLEAAASIRVAELIRELRFQSLALLHLPDALVNAIVSVALAPSVGVWALPIGVLAGKTIYLVTSYVLAPFAPRLAFDRASAAPLVQFGRWIFVVAVISFVGRSILQAVISRGLGTAALGMYALAARLAFLPSEFASELVGAVAFPLYVQLRDDTQKVTRAFRSILIGLAALLVPASAVLMVLAHSLTSDVLGPQWEGTAPVIQVLVAAGLVGLLGDALAPLFHGLGRPERQVASETIQAIVLVTGAWLFAGPLGLVGAALAWLPASCAAQGLGAFYAQRMLVRPFAPVALPLAVITAVSIGGGGLAWILDERIPGLGGFVVAVMLSGSAVIGLEWALDRWYGFGFGEDLRQVFPALGRFLPRVGTARDSQ